MLRTRKNALASGGLAVVLGLLFSASFVVAKVLKTYPDGPKWGYIDKSGETVIAPNYYSAGEFSSGRAGVDIGDSRKVLIDLHGQVLYNTAFMAWTLMRVRDGLMVVTGPTTPIKDGNYIRLEKSSYLDRQGKLWKTEYANCTDFHEGVAVARVSDYPERNVVIDLRENILFTLDELPAKFEFSEGLLAAKSKGKCGFINKDKRWVIPPSFDEAHSFNEGLAAVAHTVGLETTWGFIDHNGKLVIPYQFNIVNDFHNGRAKFYANVRKEGFIDKLGKVVIEAKPIIYDEFSEGMSSFAEGSRIGFLNLDGRVVIKPQFLAVGKFSEGLCAASVEINGEPRWGFIDRGGDWKVKPTFKGAGNFSEGRAAVLFE